MHEDMIQSIVKKKNVGVCTRHLLICTGPKCISQEKGLDVWKYLKKRLSEEGLDAEIYRSKVGCLRICTQGPIALIYPEGIWYRLIDKINVDRIIEDHIKRGIVLEDLKIAENPLFSKND